MAGDRPGPKPLLIRKAEQRGDYHHHIEHKQIHGQLCAVKVYPSDLVLLAEHDPSTEQIEEKRRWGRVRIGGHDQ